MPRKGKLARKPTMQIKPGVNLKKHPGVSLMVALGFTQAPEFVPRYKIFFQGTEVGFIQRGHREIKNKAALGLGAFSESLRQLEETERGFFKKRRFSAYKKNILEQISNDTELFLDYRAMKEISGYFVKIKNPVFIDYSFMIKPTLRLLENGYTFSKFTWKQLQQAGLKKGASINEAYDFIRENPKLEGSIFFLLFKSTKQQ